MMQRALVVRLWIAGCGASWVGVSACVGGGEPQADLQAVIARDRWRAAAPDDLWRRRAELATAHWQLGLPGVPQRGASTRNLRVVGALSSSSLQQVADDVERHVPRMAALLSLPEGRPLVKGGATIFVLARRYSYGEFGLMVEGRELPAEFRGHWQARGGDAYAVVVMPENDEYVLDILIAEQLAGLAVQDIGPAPAWFALGAGPAIASRLEPRDARLQACQRRARQIVLEGFPIREFLQGGLPPNEQSLLSYALVDGLMKSAKPFRQLLTLLQQGTPFEPALVRSYGLTPAQAATARLRPALLFR